MPRFRDGMWLPAENMWVEHAEQVYYTNEKPDGKGLNLLCPTKTIESRGHTLNRSTITMDVYAEADGIISVEATHWAGAQIKGPHFELFPQGRPEVTAAISTSDKGTTLTSGSLAVTVDPSNFDIRFHSADGSKRLTSLQARSVGLAYSPAPSNPMQTGDMRDFKHYMFTQTSLAVGETVHGLGERFGAYNKVGQSISLWNADGGTSSDQAYKNVSFWLSSKGYGIFIDTPARVDLEIGSERCTRVQTAIEGQRLKWYIIYGPTPKEVLQRYSTLTGRPGKVPNWSYGLWLTTSFTTNYDQDTVKSFLEGMKERGSPVDVFHYDCFWMKAFTWTDFVFDSERFPDPKGQIAQLKESGLCKKVCVWINPYIAQYGAAFSEAAEKGYLVKRKNGDVWQWDLWQAGMGLVDFTNPDANHENIVSLAGYLRQKPLNAKPFSDVEATEDYLVWDNCDAGNLEALLVDKNPQVKNRRVFMPESLCWHVLTSVMRALAWAHDGYRHDVDWKAGTHMWAKTDTDWMPILHRAITPASILFQNPRGAEMYGQCKLGHWGQAFVSGHPASRHDKGARGEPTISNAFGQIMAPHAEPSHLEATREVSLVEMRKSMDKYTRDGQKNHRMYTLSDEHWALGAVLYRMMTARELPSRDPCAGCAAGCVHVTACADTYCLLEEAESDQLDRWGDVDLDKTCRCDYGGCEHVREVIKMSQCTHPKWGPTCVCADKCGTKTVNIDDVLAQMDYSKGLLKAVRLLFDWDWKFSARGSVELCGKIDSLYASWKTDTGEGREYVDVRDDARRRFLVLNGLDQTEKKVEDDDSESASEAST
ncbi:hypothetical protein BN1723_001006 [Verticillium longisporum]|uniref:Protein kinase domain-containing protein n=2 Tax=Verticillium longisporum TaxID=100787 RepID=A0A0G4NDH3_VERLO|nr:hypothetical protein BN1723_001006 [Verticillium longisporum]